MTKSAIELEGKTFHFPPNQWGLFDGGPADRRIGGTMTHVAVHDDGVVVIYDTVPGSPDFSLARQGRLPLLCEHIPTIGDLLGVVISVGQRADGGAMEFQARLAATAKADHVWGLLCAGMPLGVSIGANVIAVQEETQAGSRYPTFRATRWRLTEISLCLFGADPTAKAAATPNWFEARARDLAADQAAAIRHRLHLDRWSAWPDAAAAGLAADLGVDQERARTSLQAAVDARTAGIVADLSGSAGAPTAPVPLKLAAA